MICIDMHCDSVSAAYKDGRSLALLSHQGHADIPRLLDTEIKMQFFALFPERFYHPGRTLFQVLRLLDFADEMFKESGSDVIEIRSSQDIVQCLESKKLGAVLTVEGGEALEGDIRILRILYRLGIRGLSLTWNNRNEIADGVEERQTGGGLTRFGCAVVQEMNRLGMIIDVSHLSEKGFMDVLELSSTPVIASHSNSSYIWAHARNLTDQQIKSIARKNGLIGVNLVPQFVGPPGAGPGYLMRHIDHICQLVGDDYVGFGSDFDGTEELISGVKDVTGFPVLIEALRNRGYKDESVSKICGENCLRVLRSILPDN